MEHLGGSTCVVGTVTRKDARRWLRIAVFLLLVAAVVWANRSFDLSWSEVVAETRAFVEPWGAWGPFAFIGICIFAALVHASELAVIALGGVVFGRTGGFVYGWIGGVAGGAVCFTLARYLFRDVVRASLIERFDSLERLDTQLERHGFLTVLVLRLVLFVASPMNWAIGTTRVRFRDYLAGSIVGVVPGVAVTVSFADAITEAQSLRDLLTLEMVILVDLGPQYLVDVGNGQSCREPLVLGSAQIARSEGIEYRVDAHGAGWALCFRRAAPSAASESSPRRRRSPSVCAASSASSSRSYRRSCWEMPVSPIPRRWRRSSRSGRAGRPGCG